MWAVGWLRASGSHTVLVGRGKGHKGKKAVNQNLTPGQIRSDYVMNLGQIAT